MKKYNNWNIKDLLQEQIDLNSEISARIKAALDMENSFLTYCPNGTDKDYRVLIETAMELMRKGTYDR